MSACTRLSAGERVHSAIDGMVFWQEALGKVASPQMAPQAVATQAVVPTDEADGGEPPALAAGEVRNMKVVELRAALRQRGLSEGGLKAALVARLLEACTDGATGAGAKKTDAAGGDASVSEVSVDGTESQEVAEAPAQPPAPQPPASASRTTRASKRLPR